MTQEYRPTDDEIIEALQQRDAPVPEAEEEGGAEDIFTVTEEDVMGTEGEDLSDQTDGLSPDDDAPDDMSDLIDVSLEDVHGVAPQQPQKPQPKYRIAPRGRSVVRRYPPPPTMGGMR